MTTVKDTEKTSHTDPHTRASTKKPTRTPPHSQEKQQSPSRGYANYDREGDITVNMKKPSPEEIERRRQERLKALEEQKAYRQAHPQKKKTAARTVDDLKHNRSGMLSRVAVSVNASSEKQRIKQRHYIVEKIRKSRAKKEERKEKALNRRRSTAIGRFFLDDGERYTSRTVEAKQKITRAERFGTKISDFLYDNTVTKKITAAVNFLRFCEAKFYGIVLIIFGLFSLLSYFVSAYVPIAYETDWTALAAAIFSIAVSIPLLLSKHSFLFVIEKTFIIGNIIFDFFGLRRSGETKVLPPRILLAIILGSVLGILGFFVSPVTLWVILLLAVFCALVMTAPEFGLAVTVFLLPFMVIFEHPTVISCALIILSYISYIRKLAMGKRSFRFRPCDLFVLLFSMFYLAGGLFPFSESSSSSESALVYFTIISVYFLASNLLTNKRILDTIIRSLLISGLIISLLGIFQQFGGYVTADWLDADAYAYISGRISATFDNPNVLASSLLPVIPFAIVYLFEREKRIMTTFYRAIALVALMAALVFTWSRGAWVGCAVSLLMLCAFVFRRSPKFVVAVFAGIPNLLLFAPESVWHRIASIFSFLGDEVDSSVAYRLTVWRDSLSMFFDNAFGGVGVGHEAFSAVYLKYASVGAEAALHSHNLFLEIGIEVGVFALILFSLVLVYTFRSCYSMEFAANQSSVRSACLAAFASAIALLTNGLTDYVWYNYRVCLLFWLVLGICNAAYRIATEEQRYTDYVNARISTFAAVDVPYKK